MPADPADSTPQTDKGAHAPRPRARSRPGRMALMRGLAILVWVGMLVFVPFAEKLELEKSFALAIVGCATLILLFATARASFSLLTISLLVITLATASMLKLEFLLTPVLAPDLKYYINLESLDTSAFSAFSGTCSLTPVATWQTLGIATSYSIGGGEAEKLDNTTLLDDVKQELNGQLASQSVSINVNAETFNSAAMALIEAAARAANSLVFRITLKDGSVRVFRGEPSLPGEDVQKGAIGTGSFSVSVKGFVIKTPA